MCLPDFQKIIQVDESNPIIGYRVWRLTSRGEFLSQNQDYFWNKFIEGPHTISESDSGIYAYNSNNNYNYNNYNYNNSYNNNYNNNFNYIAGTILQYGTVAIHKTGQRSEFAKIRLLYTIRESNTIESKKSLDWIKNFNLQIKDLAKKFDIYTIDYSNV